MAERDIIKGSLLSKLPEGALRQLVANGSEDLLWEAITDAILPGYDAMKEMANVRNPDVADDIESLEKEYGFVTNTNLTEEERRARIKSLKYAPAGSGSAAALQEALHIAGFTYLVVGEGRADVDPRGLAPGQGEYVVNGVDFTTIRSYDVGCNKTAGTPDDFDYGCTYMLSKYGCERLQSVHSLINYEPTQDFQLVFYVADDIQYDVNGYITSITPALIPRYYRDIIREIILRIKPIHTWCYLLVDWADPAGYGFGYFPFGITPHGL